MVAAKSGKVAEIQELLAARADPSHRNVLGRTALDFAIKAFGGVVPPLLQEALETSSRETPATTEVAPVKPFDQSASTVA